MSIGDEKIAMSYVRPSGIVPENKHVISFSVDDDTYEKLKKVREMGYIVLSDFYRLAILEKFERVKKEFERSNREYNREMKRRKEQEHLNPYDPVTGLKKRDLVKKEESNKESNSVTTI